MENVFKLDERRVAAIMTPAKDIVAIDLKWPKEEILKCVIEKKVSRVVVCKGGLTDLIGWISADEALRAVVKSGSFDIGAVQMRQMQVVPSNMSLFGLLSVLEKIKLAWR